MDNAFPTAAFPGHSSAELRDLLARGFTLNADKIKAELARRDAVAAGDMTHATAGERLRAQRTA